MLNNLWGEVFNWKTRLFIFSFFITTSLFLTQTTFAATFQEEWTDQFGSVNESNDFSHAIDSDGNVYVVGIAEGALAGQTSAGGYDAFIKKYSPTGHEIWTRQFGTAGTDSAYSVVVQGSNVYVAGMVGGSLSGQTHSGGQDAYIRRYDIDGSHFWTRLIGTAGFDEARAITCNETGVYLGGEVNDALPGQTYSGGSGDSFIRKFDHGGNEIWTKQFGTTGWDETTGLSIDAGGIYAVGVVSDALAGQTHYGSQDIYIQKYDHNGNILWEEQSGTEEYDEIYAIHSDGAYLYMAGTTYGSLSGYTNAGSSDSFVQLYDVDGNAHWTVQYGVVGYDGIFSVTADDAGIYVAGGVEGAFPGQTYLGGGEDACVRKFDMSGNEIWTREFGTTGFDEAFGIYVDGSNIYIAGYTDGAFPGFSTSTVFDVFIQKFWQDSDDDFIYDGVDTQAVTHSNDFSDANGTTGIITIRGDQTLTIIDSATTSAGVFISADISGGTTTATVNACNGSTTLDLASGNEATVTCGGVVSSAIVDVSNGTIEAAFYGPGSIVEGVYVGGVGSTTINTDIPAGNSITFGSREITFIAPSTNQDTIVLSAGGHTYDLIPGGTVDLGNEAPFDIVITASSEPNPVISTVNASAVFSDPEADDVHTVIWDWGDGTVCNSSSSSDCSVLDWTATATHTYATSGAYTLSLTVSDGALIATSSFQYVYIYDGFYGTVKINGEDAAIDTVISATGEGVTANTSQNPIETTESGVYGNNKLLVQGNVQDGTVITFYVNGIEAASTVFESDSGPTEVNLTVNASSTWIGPEQTTVTVSPDAPEIIIDSGDTALVEIIVPSSVVDATINAESLALTSTTTEKIFLTFPNINDLDVTSNTSLGEVKMKIPANTQISAADDSGWTGIVNLPAVKPNSSVGVVADSGYTASVQTIVEAGFDDIKLTLDKSVRLLIPGQAGKYVGYYRSGAFYSIITTCQADDQSTVDEQLAEEGSCKMNVGDDMVIWTKHLAKFITYTQTVINIGGGGGGWAPQPMPSISDITSTQGVDQATITWQTNESAESWLVYGTGTDYGFEATTPAHTAIRSVTLKGLSSETVYHYQIRSKYDMGNVSTYTDKTFTTLSALEGDANFDGKVDILDFNALMVNWGAVIEGNTADFNGDKLVDIFDFNSLMIYWTG